MGLFDFFRRKPTVSASEIERRLLKKVPAAVAKAKPEGQYYCLLLAIAEDFQAGWPPFVLLGNEAERQRVINQGGDWVAYNLWGYQRDA